MEKPDAGLRALDHYKSRLPWWRYAPRQWLIPLMRWETPLLAKIQSVARRPALDSYFAITANLGTHTFFMVFLPILFWCGYTWLGRGMVHILASGVFFSGFWKDLLCIPRPLSPPLQRITMSGSAALEYGFPSTHSTNAVSVAVYALLYLNDAGSALPLNVATALKVLAYFYATSIVLGRLYCGMHGFLDVIIGSLLGAAISWVEYAFIDNFDGFIRDGSIQAICIIVLIVLVLVRIHPEPADDCPCFDDSVAFAGVFCGVEVGTWHFAQTPYSVQTPVPGTVPFDLESLGWCKTILRIAVGVAVIFSWREVMKPALLKGLPPMFRIIERLGLSLPRKFFKQASEYDEVPHHIETDTVMPRMSALPNFISSIRHPGRSRSVSIGPQSAADAYEALAFRQKRRKENLSDGSEITRSEKNIIEASEDSEKPELLRPSRELAKGGENSFLPTPPASDLDLSSKATASPSSDLLKPISTPGLSVVATKRTPSQDRRENERDEREIFSQLLKPRVRYDVEVITKLIVYSGIAWLAVEGNPLLFRLLGLG